MSLNDPARVVRAQVLPDCPYCDEPMRPVGSREDREMRVTRRVCLECGWRVETAEPEPARPLPEPTDAPAGSRAKLDVLAQRAANGLQLFHPQDSRRRERADRATGAGVGAGTARAAARDLPVGVSWDRSKRLYRARGPRPRRRFLGYFATAEAAAAAARAAEVCR